MIWSAKPAFWELSPLQGEYTNVISLLYSTHRIIPTTGGILSKTFSKSGQSELSPLQGEYTEEEQEKFLEQSELSPLQGEYQKRASKSIFGSELSPLQGEYLTGGFTIFNS